MTEWNGKSTAKLNELVVREREIYAQQQELCQQHGETYRKLMVELASIFGLDAQRLVLGFWKCGVSPTGRCVYDSLSIAQEEDCLFCKKPNDRD
jgi:hypothetical protein